MNQEQLPPVIDTVARYAIGHLPATPSGLGLQSDSGLTPARLRYELEQGYFNDTYLLAPLAYFLLAFDSAILQLNLAGAELLGVPRQQPRGQLFRSFVAPSFLPDFDHFFARAVNSSEPQQIRLRLDCPRHPGGYAATLRASADASGQAIRVMLEPAEGRQAALERSEARLRRIVHSAEEGIWEIDAEARTSFVNPKMAAMLGHPIEAILGRPLVDFMDMEGRAILERNVARRESSVNEAPVFKFVRQDGSALWVSLASHPIFDGGGAYLGALALLNEVADAGQADGLTWEAASFDQLTALPKRELLRDRLNQELRKAQREERLLALLLVGLHHFTAPNAAPGREGGDAVLAEAGRRLAACVRATDTVARLDGDQFCVILGGLEQIACVERVAGAMLAGLAAPYAPADAVGLPSPDMDKPPTVSIGIALYPSNGKAAETLLEEAGLALRAAKDGGGDCYRYVSAGVQANAELRRDTALELGRALKLGQLELFYQPIVNLRGGDVVRAEALLRWRHPTRGLLSPAQFIPFAESGGMIGAIGDWVFRQAVQQVRRWQQELDPAFQISIHKSPLQFRSDATFYEGWKAYLAEQGLPPRSIVVEIGEAALLGDARQVVDSLQQMHAMGLQVALDNFGAGDASLGQLKRAGLDLLKLDQTLVHALADDSANQAMCGAIIMLAHQLGMQVVAEGVETERQRDLLIAAGCDLAQGFLFAAPLPASQFYALASAGVGGLPG